MQQDVRERIFAPFSFGSLFFGNGFFAPLFEVIFLRPFFSEMKIGLRPFAFSFLLLAWKIETDFLRPFSFDVAPAKQEQHRIKELIFCAPFFSLAATAKQMQQDVRKRFFCASFRDVFCAPFPFAFCAPF